MLVLCIVLVFVSLAFSSEETINIFGVNIYVVNEEGIATAPKGSAIIVNPCAPYEVDSGKLVLYKKDEKLSLGYGKEYGVSDGVYQITVIENNKDVIISETNLIGKAEYSSEFLGRLIIFIKSPLGVFVLAIVPCILLVIYDIIRAAALKRPLPEVIPQVKNKASEPRYIDRELSVNSEGKGTYSRTTAGRSSVTANDVLITYTAKQNKPEKPLNNEPSLRSEKKNTPIIPLTDKKKPEPSVKPKNTGALRPESALEKTEKIAKISAQDIKTDSLVKSDEVKSAAKGNMEDAFFAQTSVPQIQRNAYFRSIMNNASEKEKNEDMEEIVRPQKTSSKRSTEIIANKRVEDLMQDDDDIRDKSRYNDADEIISGFNRKV